ncbi:hypothetical protein KIN34_04490 [Cellulomonas sp. DKR-3]|uniref:Uncharacterized protein n=1 Tax=Cellulomonas fulva TaxID=2835530 RepID=A0ABS5TWK8_9CELL|nr:hypothetical protein [Cellulomonas fulva]MBT0993543.1 hypothetical protein [Cellulomonas fulva]
MLSCLTARAVVQWVTPQPGRPEFHPAAFVESTGKLYPQPWMTGPHADAVRASLVANDPAGQATTQEARTW